MNKDGLGEGEHTSKGTEDTHHNPYDRGRQRLSTASEAEVPYRMHAEDAVQKKGKGLRRDVTKHKHHLSLLYTLGLQCLGLSIERTSGRSAIENLRSMSDAGGPGYAASHKVR